MKTIKNTLSIILAVIILAASFVLTAGAAELEIKDGDVIEFGAYPQTPVEDAALSTALTTAAGSINGWNSYNYYSGTGNFDDGEMTASDYMIYADVELNGVKYRGVYFDSYRPILTGAVADWNDQEANGYNTGVIYWFEYSAIEWLVLDADEGIIVAEMGLDAQAFNNYCIVDGAEYYGDEEKEDYASDYESSSIREWLNNEFAATAFTAAELENIEQGEDTIYILDAEAAAECAPLVANATDYAKCQGVCTEDTECYWWTSTADDSGSLDVISDTGAEDTVLAVETEIAVRPALTLNLNTLEVADAELDCGNTNDVRDHKIVRIPGYEATCTTDGLTDGEMCTICGEIVKAQDVITATGHIDNDNDGYCDNCGAATTANSQTSFMNFVMKLFNTIFNLFNIAK